MMLPHTGRDRVSFRTSLSALKAPAFDVIDALQSHDGAIQVEAAGLAFVAMSQALGLDPHEMVIRHKRQLADSNAVRNAQIEAIADYAKGELNG